MAGQVAAVSSGTGTVSIATVTKTALMMHGYCADRATKVKKIIFWKNKEAPASKAIIKVNSIVACPKRI